MKWLWHFEWQIKIESLSDTVRVPHRQGLHQSVWLHGICDCFRIFCSTAFVSLNSIVSFWFQLEHSVWGGAVWWPWFWVERNDYRYLTIQTILSPGARITGTRKGPAPLVLRRASYMPWKSGVGGAGFRPPSLVACCRYSVLTSVQVRFNDCVFIGIANFNVGYMYNSAIALLYFWDTQYIIICCK